MDSQTPFFDIYEYHQTPWWHSPYVYVAAGVALLVGIGIIIFFLLRRHRPKPTAWELAYETLNKLSVDECKTTADFKRFYFTLTGTIKRYLTLQFGWQTEDKTDNELITYLKQKDFQADLCESLQTMLKGATWIKYAGQDVLKTQAKQDLTLAKNIIDQTKPVNKKFQ